MSLPTQDQIQFYRENGFVKIPDLLTPDELADLRHAAEEVLAAERGEAMRVDASEPDYRRVFVQKVNLWRVHEKLRRFTLHLRVAQVARALAGADSIRLWHDHLLVKMPGDNKPTAWHQDLPYWPHNVNEQLSCWIALQDVDETNGCMGFVPGTHRLGKLDPINLTDPQDIFSMVPGRKPEEFQPVWVPLKAGSATFHHGLTFHGAGYNHSDQPRLAFVIIYMPDGTLYTGKPHIVTDGQGLPVDQPLEGELFPVLA